MVKTLELQAKALQALMCTDPVGKGAMVAALGRAFAAGELDWQSHQDAQRIEVPGRPPTPELVHPTRVPRRRLGNVEGRKALIHAIAHIEFNAINLALDDLLKS